MNNNPMRAQSMKTESLTSCPHNEGVECPCSNRRCMACGWDPNVALERYRKMGIYPSYSDLPPVGRRFGELAYVKKGSNIFTYQWSENKWTPVTYV